MDLKTLDANGLLHFQSLQTEAINTVTARFYATHGSSYERFGPRGQDACREDLAFHLEFLRPVLEFGLLQPMVDYLRWLGSVLTARDIPAEHLAQSLDWLAEYFGAAMASAEGKVVVAALQAARIKFVESYNAPPVLPTPPAAWPEAPRFEMALLVGNQRDALSIVSQCLDEGRSLIEVELHVIQPALYNIGDKWQNNQITVAQEHMATAIVQSVMTVALLRSPPISPIDKRVLLACVEGNNHAVGLRMVADAFLLSGWDVQYLGANVPTRALVQQVADWKPDLVGLSVSFPQQFRVVKAVIAELVECLGHARPAIIVGGLAINRFTQLVEAVGADASGADAQAAVDSARRIIGKHDGP